MMEVYTHKKLDKIIHSYAQYIENKFDTEELEDSCYLKNPIKTLNLKELYKNINSPDSYIRINTAYLWSMIIENEEEYFNDVIYCNEQFSFPIFDELYGIIDDASNDDNDEIRYKAVLSLASLGRASVLENDNIQEIVVDHIYVIACFDNDKTIRDLALRVLEVLEDSYSIQAAKILSLYRIEKRNNQSII